MKKIAVGLVAFALAGCTAIYDARPKDHARPGDERNVKCFTVEWSRPLSKDVDLGTYCKDAR